MTKTKIWIDEYKITIKKGNTTLITSGNRDALLMLIDALLEKSPVEVIDEREDRNEP